MVEIKRITEKEFKDIASQLSFNQIVLTKDYFATLILFLIKDVEGIYFKGGTALQKIFLDYSRLSEDIDFSLTRDTKLVQREITNILKNSKLFDNISEDKNVKDFLRIVVDYKSFSGEKENVFIDLNKRAGLSLKHERHKIKHFYKEFIPEFFVKTLAEKEMIAEKVAAAMDRNKPRDHFDVYKLIQAHYPIDIELVKQKCEKLGTGFTITRMFNNAKKLKNRWDRDMKNLLSEEVSFVDVMKTLSKHFKLKEEKKILKKKHIIDKG